ncbi:MAG: hypothetical protein KAT46_07310 [Deltaproteobacteria bacterium]|nr:hypothetical protein [Deltaproteobacteria bacterium]
METELIKVCPSCSAEFYAHIESCNGCGIALVTPEEKLELDKNPEPTSDANIDALTDFDGEYVCVDKGSSHRLAELQIALKKSSIESEIVAEKGGGCSNSGNCLLLVTKEYGQAAANAIRDHWHSEHPEIAEAEANMAEGKCPCCGFDAGSASECPDCGLNLAIPIEEGDDDCSTC